MKLYIFRHLTWWCLEIRDEFEGLAFPAFVDDATAPELALGFRNPNPGSGTRVLVRVHSTRAAMLL